MNMFDGLQFKHATRRDEHRLQSQCVKWFRYQYPQYAPLLFAVPNAGKRGKVVAAEMKAEGLWAGVADLILLHAKGVLLIEMKTEKGRQSDSQKTWQKAVEAQGYRYEVVRSFEEFEKLIKNFLAI